MAEAWGGELLPGGDNDIKATMEITGMRVPRWISPVRGDCAGPAHR